MNRDYGKNSNVTGYADGGKVEPPPELGGAVGQAQKQLSGRAKQIDDAERKAVGYANGGKIRGYADGGEMGGSGIDQGRAMPALESGDQASLGDRLRAGNIDDPKSAAYNRWGDGSKGAEASDAGGGAANGPAVPDDSTQSAADASDQGGGSKGADATQSAADASDQGGGSKGGSAPGSTKAADSKTKATVKKAAAAFIKQVSGGPKAPAASPMARRSSVDQIPLDTMTPAAQPVKDFSAKGLTLGTPIQPGDYDRGAAIARASMTNKMADGGIVGGRKHYGKK